MAKKKPAEKPYFVRLVVSLIVCMRICLATEESSTMKIPINIGTIVNMDSWVGKVGLSCLNMALSDFYSSHPQYKTRLFLHINDTNTDVVHAAFAVINSMQGVIGIKTHEPKTEELENFRVRWKRQFLQENPTMVDAQLNVFGLWAYDAAFALAMAVEKVGGKGLGFRKLNASGGLTDLDNIGVSENGPKLSEALSTTRFRGLAGDFSFVNGQLQSSTLQIVNVHGHGIRSVGFWTPNNGLTRKLNSTSTYSTSKSNLGPIIWPGDTTSQPMGYTKYPTTFGKKLRLAVTVKDNISSFVQVVNDSSRNKPEFTGFCIEVFKAVMDAMPYPVIYDFIPFSKPNGKRAGTNNDLIYQVYLGAFPRGSPLIGEISRAILNITEGKKMKEIEDVWFAKNNCSSTEDSFSLGLNSVWGLFLIAGIASLSALVICVCTFLYKHRQILISFDSEASISRKIRVMFKIFDEKDPSSHTFKKTGELQDSRGRSLDGNMHLHDKGMEVIEASQNTNCPPSPSNYSSQSQLNFAFPAGEARNSFQN
ncbi:hypothetical protein FEM48_Zijuj06G0062100 [Ziziphus jujuba var. spinosa]|uniref:Receptor ligand binding region domain-containing protein n=1 Tax=Ziziphus jujuba var. spinosa TaxID=714518 RepID=A0A978V7M4_ZIZJJ|nr:hypothetical protein FEM48_Zijuj06G0062100 [Ziziphus jujuba var. spinosa]